MISQKETFDVVEVIARSPWFKAMPSEAHQELAAASRVREFARNSYLFTTGEVSNDVYCVLSGRIRLSISSALGQEFAITDLGPDSWLGEQILAGDLPRVLDAQIAEKAAVLLIARQPLQSIGERFPQMYRDMFIQHIHRSRGVYVLLSGMAFYPLKSRLAGRLLELAEKHGQPGDGGIYLNLNISQNDFARLSLGSRQRVNKILGEWRDRGIVVVENNNYLIKDLAALEAETELQQED